MNNFADTTWAVSLPNRDSLRDEFGNASAGSNPDTLSIKIDYEFERSVS
jgi:hypothetical protein